MVVHGWLYNSCRDLGAFWSAAPPAPESQIVFATEVGSLIRTSSETSVDPGGGANRAGFPVWTAGAREREAPQARKVLLWGQEGLREKQHDAPFWF